MNNACTSRWCRRLRIITKRQWRRFEKHPMRLFWWLTGIITAIFILCIIFAGSSETAYTAFGSYFTALAFVGVIVTVLLQRAELQEQRKELRAQRIELEGQKRELEIQNRTAQLQRFENSFFHLLEDFKLTTNVLQGHESRFGTPALSYSSTVHRMVTENKNNDLKYIKIYMENLFIKSPTAIKRFILNYYEIVYFIYSHDAFIYNKKEIKKYTSILNLYLTNSEYFTLFYDAIRDDKKIKIINELHIFSRYSLLNKSYTPLKPEHILFFSPQAFGEDYEEYIRRHDLQGKTLEDFLQ